MKKTVTIVLLIIMLLSVFSLPACATEDVYENVVTHNFTATAFEEEMDAFLDLYPDRTFFSDAEEEASQYLDEKLQDFGFTTTTQNVSYTYSMYTTSYYYTTDYTFSSQNIIGSLSGNNAGSGAKKIVIGTGYDNVYSYNNLSDAYYSTTDSATKAEGALMGTGVVATLQLAKALSDYNDSIGLACNIEVAFFGAELYNCAGSNAYLDSSNTTSIDLYIDMGRMGGDNIYTYFDEVQTEYGETIMDNADSLGYDNLVTEVDGTFPTIATTTTGNELPYTNYSLMRTAGAFVGNNVKVASFATGSWESFLLSPRESMSYYNIAYTSSDTLKMLSTICSQYSTQMAVITDIVYDSLTGDSSLFTALDAEIYDYSWLTYPFVAYVATIVLLIIFAIILILFIKKYEKKYPYKQSKKVTKMAVFGKDYDVDSDDVNYVDVKLSQDPFGDYEELDHKIDTTDKEDPFA